jgi:acyl-CoA reductase-like NAD-dependent aldehyde dehydrogenase
MQGAVGLWEFAATVARDAYGDLHDKIGAGALGLVFREPVGVVGMVTRWNYYQEIGRQKLPFDDVAMAQRALSLRRGGSRAS